MHWRIKATIQALLGLAPRGDQLHYWLQRRAGGLRHFADELAEKVQEWELMVDRLGSVGVSIVDRHLVEIGTGWYPTLPLCCYLAGAARVETFDLNRHLKPDLTVACAVELGRQIDRLARASGCSSGSIAAKQRALVAALERGAELDEATGGVVRYRAPGDASATGLSAGTVDLVFSNSVLEHIPREGIAGCFAEARRILAPTGVIFHAVNCGDHYAATDRSITELNYLRYSDRAWRRWNNRFLYQNRLRAIDFIELARDAGFAIELENAQVHPRRLAQLATIPVDPTLAARYSREQLAITYVDFIGRR